MKLLTMYFPPVMFFITKIILLFYTLWNSASDVKYICTSKPFLFYLQH